MKILYVYCHPLPEILPRRDPRRSARRTRRGRPHGRSLRSLRGEIRSGALGRGAARLSRRRAQPAHRHGLRAPPARDRRADLPVSGLVVRAARHAQGLDGPPVHAGRRVRPVEPEHVQAAAAATCRRIAGITTYGRPWWNALLVGNPPKKIMTRYLPRFTGGSAKVDYYPLYHMNVATLAQREASWPRCARR